MKSFLSNVGAAASQLAQQAQAQAANVATVVQQRAGAAAQGDHQQGPPAASPTGAAAAGAAAAAAQQQQALAAKLAAMSDAQLRQQVMHDRQRMRQLLDQLKVRPAPKPVAHAGGRGRMQGKPRMQGDGVGCMRGAAGPTPSAAGPTPQSPGFTCVRFRTRSPPMGRSRPTAPRCSSS